MFTLNVLKWFITSRTELLAIFLLFFVFSLIWGFIRQ